jgi:hypothetical protein
MNRVLTDLLSSGLRPLCSRDNHIMKYESGGSRANTASEASYHCSFRGCSVRYDSAEGYFTLMAMPGQTYVVDEPGANTERCPKHNRWLYRGEDIDAQHGVHWRCGIEGCDYVHLAKTKGVG